MNCKYYIAFLLFGGLLIISSCKKIDIQSESLHGEIVSNNVTANEVLETEPPSNTPRTIAINSNVSGFYETLPARYSITTKKYPLIVFLHGGGELGTGLSRLTCCGIPYFTARKLFPPKFYYNGAYYSYIVISPQFRVRPSAYDIQSVVNYAKNHYRIEASRIYVTGLSMGGGGTWLWSAAYGQYAAGVVPVCADLQPTTTLASNVASKNLPIWGIYSDADYIVPEQWGRDWFNWIDARNTAYASKTKLTIWSGISHNSTWAKAYNPSTRVDGYNIYEWMLRYTRSTTASSFGVPVANAGKDQTIPISWKYYPTLNATLSYDPDGWIKSFKWSKVSGPSSYWFSNMYAGQTKANGLVAGTYVFRVTVTDNSGKTDTDDVNIYMTNN
jgi:dienelactone hydrolase